MSADSTTVKKCQIIKKKPIIEKTRKYNDLWDAKKVSNLKKWLYFMSNN